MRARASSGGPLILVEPRSYKLGFSSSLDTIIDYIENGRIKVVLGGSL
jgi:hypothetical protein